MDDRPISLILKIMAFAMFLFLLAFGFVNVTATVATASGSGPLFGTNPVALAVPRAGREPLMLDQSLSALATWLTGANPLIETSSFADDAGGSPGSGQFFTACDIGALAQGAASERLAPLLAGSPASPVSTAP